MTDHNLSASTRLTSQKRKYTSSSSSNQPSDRPSSPASLPKQSKMSLCGPQSNDNFNQQPISNTNEDDVLIDEGLYSRMLYVMGKDGLKLIFGARVLVSGLGGLGCEVAKNLILGGVGRLLLHDQDTVNIQRDLSSNFYFNEKDVGENRVNACKDKLAELNPYVKVSSFLYELSENVVQRHF
ncbi:hypothetical protein ACOME3_007059 [Neoechinorhynchus agilis]